MYFILCILFIFWCIFSNFLLWKNLLIFCLCYDLLCRRGINHFDYHFWRIRPVLFPSRDGNSEVYAGRNGRRGVYFRQSWHFSFIDMFKVLFPIFTLNYVNNYVFRQGKGISRRNKTTTTIISFCSFWYCISFPENVNCLLRLKLSLIIRGNLSLLLKKLNSVFTTEETFPSES